MNEVFDTIAVPRFRLVLRIQYRIFSFEIGDFRISVCHIRGISNHRITGSEEFSWVELNLVPGWVADYAGETAGPASGRIDAGGAVADAEDVGELDVPVEEAVLAGQVRYQVLGGPDV